MSRGLFSCLAFALTFGFTNLGDAHHPPKMDKCASFSFEGRIERIEWRAPHVELFVRTEEGMTHHVGWLAINQLGVAGIDSDTLKVGDQVAVTAGIRIDDTTARPMLLSYIHRDRDGWGWSQRPQGC